MEEEIMTCVEKELKQFKDAGFREIEKQFVYVRCPELLDSQKDLYEITDKDDGFFGLGYVDYEAGLTVRIISPAHIENNHLIVGGENRKSMSLLRAEAIADNYFNSIDINEVDLSIYGIYPEQAMSYYEGCEKAVELRNIEILDQFRHPCFPDDVEIHFIGEKIETENMWLRLTKVKDKTFYGKLLDEPVQKLGIHIGEETSFNLIQMKDGSVHALHICE